MSCAPCQADAPPLGIPGTYATSTEPAPPPPQDAAGWEGILGFEGVLTGDSRLIERNALVWDTPLPLRFVKEDVGGHQNAVVVGRIETIARGQGGAVEACRRLMARSVRSPSAPRNVTAVRSRISGA